MDLILIISEFISNTKITYSIVQSGSLQSQTDVSSLTNKPRNADPLFVNHELPASLAPSTSGDFHVRGLSPAINMGDNTSNTTSVDLDNVPRMLTAPSISAHTNTRVWTVIYFLPIRFM